MNNQELVIVDAGHGGIDSGAVGNGLEEKDLNLQTATYIYDRLQELGIPSVITRTDDEYLPKDARVNRIRSITNNNPNTLLISNHINAGGGEGAEVVYSLKNNSNFANLILDNIGEKGQIKRKVYQRRLPENPNKDYYYILRETNAKEPVLIEYGFIDNAKDANKLSNNLNDYAEAVVESIAEYLGYPYTNNTTQDEYIVKKGDTLYSISRKYGISVDELKKINNLIDNTLTIGQVLKLKQVGQIDNPIYIVQKGDSLWSIAKNNNTTVEDIIELNKLKTNTLLVGQELYIPTGNINSTIPDDTSNENNNGEDDIITDGFSIYTVEKGDSLWKISRKFDIDVPDLIDINNLKDLTLQIGQKLLVPGNTEIANTNSNYYIVQKGDTLWSIARDNDMTVNEIKELNNLTSNLLSVGQQLKINN